MKIESLDNNENYSNKNLKKNVIYISIFTFTLILLEYTLRDYLKNLQLTITSYFSIDCKIISHFDFYDVAGRYFLLSIIYNLTTVYAAFVFIFLDCITVFLNGMIRLFYLDSRPFWDNPDLTPCFCAIDYGDPSTTGINLFINIALIYKSFTYDNNSKLKKNLLFLLGVVLYSYTCLVRIFQNVHYIHQLLYGLGLGYIIYYIFFDIIEVKFDNEKEFKTIINNPVKIILLTTIIYFASNVIHLCLDLKPNTKYLENISKHCKIINIFSFDNESYTKSTRLFEYLGYYIGIYLEYRINFKGNYNLFTRYNIISKYNEKFNDTNNYYSMLRIIIMYIFHLFYIHNMILTKYITAPNESMVFSLIVRLILPYFIEGVIMFFLIKNIFRLLKLTNDKIFDTYDKNDLLLNNIDK